MVLFETRGLQLSSVIRGGIGWEWRLEQAYGLTFPWILALEPSVSRRTRLAIAKDDPKGWNGLLVRNAQAACGFSCSASKRAPFFQMIRVIAAIFRAKVSRAIAGSMPFVSKPW